jgi:cytochrome c oxidase subunit 2
MTLLISACSGSGPQSALDPMGPIAEDIDELWTLVYVLAFVVFVLVMGLLVWAIFRYRDRGQEEEPKQLHGNMAIELGGVVFSVVLLTIIGIPTVSTLLDIRGLDDDAVAVEVTVTGHQWWWEFEYQDITSDDGRWIKTANELHIPADTNVKLVMGSADVIHSFWVPALNGKRDVVPGAETILTLHADSGDLAASDAHDPSIYIRGDDVPEGLIAVIPGQCAEFCGLAHADMRIRVFVHDDAGFDRWAAEQLVPAALPAGVDDDEPTGAALGYTVFDALCTTCHQAAVEGPDGTVELVGAEFAPDLTHFGSRETFGSATFVNDPDHLRQWLAQPSDLKPMDPDRNDLSIGRILGMPNLGLSAEEIAGLQELLQEMWK